MKLVYVVLVFMLPVIIPGLAFGDRQLLEKPAYDTDLGDSSRDIEVLDALSGKYVFRDSEATATFDPTRGTYYFRFKDDSGNWCEARWVPRSNIDVVLVSEVQSLDGDSLQYTFTIRLMQESLRVPVQVTMEVLSKISDESTKDESDAERGRRWEGGEWVGQELHLIPGRRLWAWARYTDELPTNEARVASTLRLDSNGLPFPLPCWVQGDGNSLFSECEPVYSVSKFHAERGGVLTDVAKGITVAPGLESVQLPALKDYLNTSIEQGWLEEGEYLDQVKALLETALQEHEAGNTTSVPCALKDLDTLVEEAYRGKDSPILSEAYALFHFNIAYLLEHYEEDLLKAGNAEGAVEGE